MSQSSLNETYSEPTCAYLLSYEPEQKSIAYLYDTKRPRVSPLILTIDKWKPQALIGIWFT